MAGAASRERDVANLVEAVVQAVSRLPADRGLADARLPGVQADVTPSGAGWPPCHQGPEPPSQPRSQSAVGQHSRTGSNPTPADDQSEPEIIGHFLRSENIEHPAVVFDPGAGRWRDPSCDIQIATMVGNEIPREYRFMVSNPVAQGPQFIQWPVSLPARQRVAMCKGAAQCRSPERHLVVCLATSCRPASGTQQRNPESERQGCHDPVRIDTVAIARHYVPGAPDPLQGTIAKTSMAAVVPAAPYRSPSLWFMAFRSAISRTCSGP